MECWFLNFNFAYSAATRPKSAKAWGKPDGGAERGTSGCGGSLAPVPAGRLATVGYDTAQSPLSDRLGHGWEGRLHPHLRQVSKAVGLWFSCKMLHVIQHRHRELHEHARTIPEKATQLSEQQNIASLQVPLLDHCPFLPAEGTPHWLMATSHCSGVRVHI